MKKVLVSTLAIIVIFFLGVGNSFSGNPADVTIDDRVCGDYFFKITYDGGPKSIFANIPVKKSIAISLFGWQDEKSENRSSEIRAMVKIMPELDGSLLCKDAGETEITHALAFDYRPFDFFGAGCIIPLEHGEDIKIGPRFAYKNFHLYSTFVDNYSAYGVSYRSKVVNVELAYADSSTDVSYARISKGFSFSFGNIIPEFRFKNSTEKFYGIGIGFVPRVN